MRGALGRRLWLTVSRPAACLGALFALGALSLSAGGCSANDPAKPTVFGGQGAMLLAPNERPLPAASAPEEAGPCGRESPPNDVALLDDFEDGDSQIFKGFQRVGYWWSAGDNTDGSLVKPSGTFAPELLPPSESTKENRFAAHLSASGQKQWGAVWGTALHFTDKGIRCPLNMSRFAGVRFRAKGPGRVRLNFSVPEVLPKDAGGTCKEGCYDSHGKLFLLSDHWDAYSVRWDRLEQGGWGTEARFTPSRIISMSLQVSTKELPVDFWIDDIELIPGDATAPARTVAGVAPPPAR